VPEVQINKEDLVTWMEKVRNNSQGHKESDVLSDADVGQMLLDSLGFSAVVDISSKDSVDSIATKVLNRIISLVESDKKRIRTRKAAKEKAKPAKPAVKGGVTDTIRKALKESEAGLSIEELAKSTGLSMSSVKATVGRLHTQGEVTVHADDTVTLE
tara:strand:- start:53 stop:523 length:471 start_codon:yes stop_codon:yes gene_type:complete